MLDAESQRGYRLRPRHDDSRCRGFKIATTGSRKTWSHLSLRSRTEACYSSGQTEASVDIARIAGLYPAGVICEIMNEDGTMARLPELQVSPSNTI